MVILVFKLRAGLTLIVASPQGGAGEDQHMFKKTRCSIALACLGLLGLTGASAGTFIESFALPPQAAGWRIFGATNLFVWDQEVDDLHVTWDSSQTNSYFYRPLGTVLAKDDSFALEFDLRLDDIATGAKSGPFEIAVGLINFQDAIRPGFWRGSGVNDLHGPRNLVEFDYFPAGYIAGWGNVDPSISPTIVSANNGFGSAFTLLELTNGASFHVVLAYTGTNQTLRTALSCNGSPFGSVDSVVLNIGFSDFRVDTVAVCSYSDIGDDYDSVLAHGRIDNITVTLPPSPIADVVAQLKGGSWQVQLQSRTNWQYSLERTQDLGQWETAGAPVPGSGSALLLQDLTPPNGHAFYRVSAARP